ncbi:MAG: hypothetical protein ACOCQ2_01890 [Halanaerobiales bacterium]
MTDKQRRERQDFCCCKDEIACLLKRLSSGSCSEIEVFLTTGSECCTITGTICDIIAEGCILVLCETSQNTTQCSPSFRRRGKCYIAVDKIAAVCEVCGSGFPPGQSAE